MQELTDKDLEYIEDATEDRDSECCGAKVIAGFCMACKEHC